MGTVTNLGEFRNKKSAKGDFRDMTEAEWEDYLMLRGTKWPDYVRKRKEAVDRCFVIVEQLATFEYKLEKNLGYRRFSEAAQRALLRAELLELTMDHGFIEFTGWL